MSVAFMLNGQHVQADVPRQMSLLSYLRGVRCLKGAKNGCGKGQCGACTVLVDGSAKRSCLLKVEDVNGRLVETVEGLARGELLHAIQYAFIVEDAVQCGFCTPGMIMATKALLDRNSDPTEEQIRKALRWNLCRCTGYVKIVEAVKTAARLIREGKTHLPVPRVASGSSVIGSSIVRAGALERVTGAPLFAADLECEGVLFGKMVLSGVASAEILEIDASAAHKVPGVVSVLTHEDIPGRKTYGLITKHQPVLVFNRVRMVGDPVALVLAETEEAAAEGASLVKVSFRELPGVFSPAEALRDGAPRVHPEGNVLRTVSYQKGDPEAVFRRDDVVIVEGEYYTPFIEHAYMEPEACLAVPDPDGVTVYCPSQGSYPYREQIAASLCIPEERCRVVYVPAGGAFGGREEPLVCIQAALGARVTGRPVKIVLTREESIKMSTKRHAEYLKYRTAASRDGKLLAQDIEILTDTGAYASGGGPVATRSASFAAGPYYIPNVRVRLSAVYTNNPTAGAMRGFGSPQVAFAAETQMERLAVRLGLDSFTIREMNALLPGKTTATGDLLGPGNALPAVIRAVKERLRDIEIEPSPEGMKRGVGLACAYKNVGLGTGRPESAGAILELLPDGCVCLMVGCVDSGQGSDTAMAQLAAEGAGLPVHVFKVRASDTACTPDCGITTGSRMTFLSGNAVYRAAQVFRDELFCAAAFVSGVSEHDISLNGQEILVRGEPLSLADLAGMLEERGRRLSVSYTYEPPATAPIPEVVEDPPADPASQRLHYAYCFAAQGAVVDVNPETGEVRVRCIVAASDVGRAIHPKSIEGQIEGGVAMGLGYALYEELKVDRGRVITDDLVRLGIPRATQVPPIYSIIVEDAHPDGPLGAKGMAELPTAATAPAICNAIYRATGWSPSRLPVRPEQIKHHCQGGNERADS
ncbi:MAG: molybdopterin cofactor-binding domain-containing protein [Bacillota bacterium]